LHPLDTEGRLAKTAARRRHRRLQHHEMLHQDLPEGITITDNAIVPLKERVVDQFYDPVKKLFRIFSG